MKLVFPSALAAFGEKLNTVVNYKAALTTLGEGLSGEKKFTAALGEALTYAFSPEASETPVGGGLTENQGDEATSAPSVSAAPTEGNTVGEPTASGEAVQTFSESDGTKSDAQETDNEKNAVSNAVRCSFFAKVRMNIRITRYRPA